MHSARVARSTAAGGGGRSRPRSTTAHNKRVGRAGGRQPVPPQRIQTVASEQGGFVLQGPRATANVPGGGIVAEGLASPPRRRGQPQSSRPAPSRRESIRLGSGVVLAQGSPAVSGGRRLSEEPRPILLQQGPRQTASVLRRGAG
eukprot:2367795-Prymnesium_polylepis.1